jgi:hypothetical protein
VTTVQVTHVTSDSSIGQWTIRVRRVNPDTYLGEPPPVTDLPADIIAALRTWLEGVDW